MRSACVFIFTNSKSLFRFKDYLIISVLECNHNKKCIYDFKGTTMKYTRVIYIVDGNIKGEYNLSMYKNASQIGERERAFNN